jgi:hypothetical protein
MTNQELVKEENKRHRDEMNLIEFPIGALAERVPIDPSTGQERTEMRLARTITDNGECKEQVWIMRGDPNYGGLPRGYDLDVFTAIMTEWGKSDFQNYLISLGSVYRFLHATGRRDRPEDYARLEKALLRWFGASFETRHAVYDPNQRRRESRFVARFFSSLAIRNTQIGDVPKGAVRVTPEFHGLLEKGYLKLTDIERYWRLPDSYTRRLFQYLDKHRSRSLRENRGILEINGYLLAMKLGTFEETVQGYKPWKLRDVMGSHLDALKADGYLTDYRWKREGKGRAPICLEVTYTADRIEQHTALQGREVEAVARIGRELGEPENRAYHERVVTELGVARTLDILAEVTNRAHDDPHTHRGKLFTYLAQQARGVRSGPRMALKTATRL